MHGRSYMGAKLGSSPSCLIASVISTSLCYSAPCPCALYLRVTKLPMTGWGPGRPAATQTQQSFSCLTTTQPLAYCLLMLLCVIWVLLIFLSFFLSDSSMYKNLQSMHTRSGWLSNIFRDLMLLFLQFSFLLDYFVVNCILYIVTYL